MKNICKNLECRLKPIKTKLGAKILAYEYKCKLKGGGHMTSKTKVCKECPLQLSLFE